MKECENASGATDWTAYKGMELQLGDIVEHRLGQGGLAVVLKAHRGHVTALMAFQRTGGVVRNVNGELLSVNPTRPMFIEEDKLGRYVGAWPDPEELLADVVSRMGFETGPRRAEKVLRDAEAVIEEAWKVLKEDRA